MFPESAGRTRRSDRTRPSRRGRTARPGLPRGGCPQVPSARIRSPLVAVSRDREEVRRPDSECPSGQSVNRRERANGPPRGSTPAFRTTTLTKSSSYGLSVDRERADPGQKTTSATTKIPQPKNIHRSAWPTHENVVQVSGFILTSGKRHKLRGKRLQVGVKNDDVRCQSTRLKVGHQPFNDSCREHRPDPRMEHPVIA